MGTFRVLTTKCTVLRSGDNATVTCYSRDGHQLGYKEYARCRIISHKALADRAERDMSHGRSWDFVYEWRIESPTKK